MSYTNLGFLEIFLVVVVLFVVWRGLHMATTRAGSSMTSWIGTGGQTLGAATARAYPIANRRYAAGVQGGSLAELFGLGPRGIRWPQVLVVTVGTWLGDNMESLVTYGISSPGWSLLWPGLFVLAAITAVRSFQHGTAVAIATGTLYAVMTTAVRLVLSSDVFSLDDPGRLLRSAGLSFLWPFLTMAALWFAVSGPRRWLRMVLSLTAVSVLVQVINPIVYEWGSGYGPETVVARLPWILVSNAVWVMAFWFGETRYGGRRLSSAAR